MAATLGRCCAAPDAGYGVVSRQLRWAVSTPRQPVVQQFARQQVHSQQPQQQRGRPCAVAPRASTRSAHCACSLRRGSVVTRAAAAPSALDSIEELVGPAGLEPDVFEIITYALKLAWTAETYYVHSWMVLLGLLKKERCTAAAVLQDLGLDDLYGAWNEVLWALNVSDGLTPRAFTPKVAWGERAALILQGAVRFGGWAGRPKVASEDLLMAFAASDVLTALFPDVDLSFDRVRRAVEKRTGVRYELPGDMVDGVAVSSQDMFL